MIEASELLIREKERLNLVHETELNSKDKLQEFNLQSQKRQLD